MSEIKLACEVAEQVKAICDKHGNLPGELINILHEAQHLQGYLPEEMQRLIAHKLNIPVSKVYGVVTFYTFFTMTPKGKFSLDCLRCVGACGLAPVVIIGEKVYGRLQSVDVKKIIEDLE